MEQWKKVLLIGITLFVLAFLCLHMFVNIRGKDILSQKLEEAFNRKIKIGSLYTTFPANLYIKNIEVQGLFKIEEVIAGRGLIDIFNKDFNLSFLKIIKPVINLEKEAEKPAQETASPQEVTAQKDAVVGDQPKAVATNGQLSKENVTKQQQVNLNLFALSIGKFIVSDGTLNFIDRSMADKELVIKVENINLKVDNFNLSGRGIQVISFDLKGMIPWRKGVEKGKIQTEGWINLAKKDIQAILKIEDIDGVYLYPYYSAWVDLEKVRIEKANLNFTSNIHGLNNNVTAECHLELTDIVRKVRPAEEPVEKEEKIASAVLDMFKTLDQGRIVLNFTIRTRMDRPEFGFGNIKMAVQDKFAQARSAAAGAGPQDLLILPVKLVEGVIKGATDVSKAMVEGTFAVGNEIKKSLEHSFKKEPK